MSFAAFNTVRKDQTKAPEKVGIGGFTTYATVNERISGTRILPTSTLESGRYANDDVIIEPITIDLTIDIADTFVELGAASAPVKTPPNLSGLIAQFIPARTEAQVQKISALAKSTVEINKQLTNKSLPFSSGGGGSSVTKNHREQFMQFLADLYNSDAIIDLQTRFKTYENMALAAFDTEVNNEGQSIKATLSFQQLDFRELEEVAVTAISSPQGSKVSPAAAKTTGSPQDKGAQGATSGKKADERKTKSVLTSVFGR